MYLWALPLEAILMVVVIFFGDSLVFCASRPRQTGEPKRLSTAHGNKK